MFRFVFLLVLLSWPTLIAGVYSAQSPAQATKSNVSSTLTVRKVGSWKRLEPGIEHRSISLERSEPNYFLELKLVRLDPSQIAARVISSGEFQLKGGDAKTLAQRSGAVATINASYFDEKGKPLAFLKMAGQDINRGVAKHALYTGVFGLRDSTPFIMHRDNFEAAQFQEAVQSGPLLLNQGAALQALPGVGRYSRRSVIGVDKQHRLVIGVTDTVLGGLSFAELQELFSNPKWQLETPDLLNLDGGGSAQLYVKTKKLEEFISGTSEVPIVIGFFRKTN